MDKISLDFHHRLSVGGLRPFTEGLLRPQKISSVSVIKPLRTGIRLVFWFPLSV